MPNEQRSIKLIVFLKKMLNQNKCNYWKCANRIGLFLVVLFVICFIWYYVRSVEQDLHLRLLKLSFFGFSGMNITSFILGAVQSYIWGYIVVCVLRLVGCCRRKDNKK